MTWGRSLLDRPVRSQPTLQAPSGTEERNWFDSGPLDVTRPALEVGSEQLHQTQLDMLAYAGCGEEVDG